jgi:hypothetical protein
MYWYTEREILFAVIMNLLMAILWAAVASGCVASGDSYGAALCGVVTGLWLGRAVTAKGYRRLFPWVS